MTWARPECELSLSRIRVRPELILNFENLALSQSAIFGHIYHMSHHKLWDMFDLNLNFENLKVRLSQNEFMKSSIFQKMT